MRGVEAVGRRCTTARRPIPQKKKEKKEVSVARWVGRRDESNLTATGRWWCNSCPRGCWKGSPPLQSMEAGRVWRMSGPSCLFCQDLVGLCISSPHSPSSTQQPQLSGTAQNPSRDIMFCKWHEPRHGMVGKIVQLSQQNSTMDAESKLWPWHPKTTQRRTETRPKKKKKQPHQQDGGPSSLLPSSSPNKDSTFFTTDEIKSSSASKKSNPSLCDTMWTFPRFL